MRRAIQIVTLSMIASLFAACDRLQVRPNSDSRNQEHSSSAPTSSASSATDQQRFVFPAQTGAFPAYSVALDTRTGQLCKTYSWADNQNAPRALPLCSELAAPVTAFLSGASKEYRGFTYKFDGSKWNKGRRIIDLTTQDKDPKSPYSDDQYDPLNLFSKEEKAKILLTVTQIRQVADQFGVSYEEAREDAKAQGYRVPPKQTQ